MNESTLQRISLPKVLISKTQDSSTTWCKMSFSQVLDLRSKVAAFPEDLKSVLHVLLKNLFISQRMYRNIFERFCAAHSKIVLIIRKLLH